MPHTPLHGLLDAFITTSEGSVGPQWAFEQEHNMKDYYKMLREKKKREFPIEDYIQLEAPSGLIGSTYDPELGGSSPPNFQALGLVPDVEDVPNLFEPQTEFEIKIGRDYVADTLDLDRLIRSESGNRPGRTSSKGAYGLAQFKPDTYANWHKDAEITGVAIPKVFEGKEFKEVMDDPYLARLAAKTYMRMLERYLERRNLPVTIKNLLGSYNMGPTKYARFLRNSKEGVVSFPLWNMWLESE